MQRIKVSRKLPHSSGLRVEGLGSQTVEKAATQWENGAASVGPQGFETHPSKVFDMRLLTPHSSKNLCAATMSTDRQQASSE